MEVEERKDKQRQEMVECINIPNTSLGKKTKHNTANKTVNVRSALIACDMGFQTL